MAQFTPAQLAQIRANQLARQKANADKAAANAIALKAQQLANQQAAAAVRLAKQQEQDAIRLANQQAAAQRAANAAAQRQDKVATQVAINAQKSATAVSNQITNFQTLLLSQIASAGKNALSPGFQARFSSEQSQFARNIALKGGAYTPLDLAGVSPIVQNSILANQGIGLTNASSAAQLNALAQLYRGGAVANQIVSQQPGGTSVVTPTPIPVVSNVPSFTPIPTSVNITTPSYTPPSQLPDIATGGGGAGTITIPSIDSSGGGVGSSSPSPSSTIGGIDTTTLLLIGGGIVAVILLTKKKK